MECCWEGFYGSFRQFLPVIWGYAEVKCNWLHWDVAASNNWTPGLPKHSWLPFSCAALTPPFPEEIYVSFLAWSLHCEVHMQAPQWTEILLQLVCTTKSWLSSRLESWLEYSKQNPIHWNACFWMLQGIGAWSDWEALYQALCLKGVWEEQVVRTQQQAVFMGNQSLIAVCCDVWMLLFSYSQRSEP